MKYKLIGNNFYFFPLDQVLQNRGISRELFEVDESKVLDYNGLDNINEGVNLLLRHLKNNSNINLVVDSDVDGNTSGAIIYRYIKKIKPNANITYLVHEGKEHGLSHDIHIEEDCDLVILPDSSSNDYLYHKILKDLDKQILIMDHHEAERKSEYAIVINNQLSDYPNKDLSGVGVTWQFCRALDDKFCTSYTDRLLDLVALGNISCDNGSVHSLDNLISRTCVKIADTDKRKTAVLDILVKHCSCFGKILILKGKIFLEGECVNRNRNISSCQIG